MAEGAAEVTPEGEDGAGHPFGEVQQGELLQAFDEHRGLLFAEWWKGYGGVDFLIRYTFIITDNPSKSKRHGQKK